MSIATKQEATNMSDHGKRLTNTPSKITQDATRALESSINESDAAMRVLRRMNHDPALVSRVRDAQDILYTVLFELTKNPESPGSPLMPPPPISAPVETRLEVDPKDMRAIRAHDHRMKDVVKKMDVRIKEFEQLTKNFEKKFGKKAPE